MKIRLPSMEKCAFWLVFLFYASTNSFWGYSLFHDSDAFAAAASLLPTLLFLGYYCFIRWKPPISVLVIVISMYLVIVIRSSFSVKQILFYGMCAVMLLDTKMAERPSYLKVFYYFSFLFAAGSMIYLFLPNLYRAVILPAFSGSTQYRRLMYWTRRSGFVTNPGFTNQTSFNACHFVYGLGYLFCGFFVWGKKLHRRWPAVVLLFICLVITNKRAHFGFLFISLALTYYVSGGNKKRGKRFLLLVLVGTAMLSLLLFLAPRLNLGVFSKISETLEGIENDEDVTSGRITLYGYALKYFLENPVFGIGWEGYRRIPETGIGNIQTHNIYLELLCETGIVGFSVFLVFFVYALKTAIKNCNTASNKTDVFAASFCLFMQIFFLLYGLLGNPLYDPPYYIPYFIVCTFAFSQRKRLSSNWKYEKREYQIQ